MSHLLKLILILLSVGAFACLTGAQATPYAIDLASLFDTSTCQVTNAFGPRPKVAVGNEQEGCAEANVAGRTYTSVLSGPWPIYSATPVAAKNVFIHPPAPAWQYTRVRFGSLDTIQNGVSQADDWVLTFACGITYSVGSTSDGVDLRIIAGGVSQGCQGAEVVLHSRTVLYGQEPEYVTVVVPDHIIQRPSSFLTLEVRPRSFHDFDHFVVSNPVLRPAVASLSLADSFAAASVITAGYVPLTTDWLTLTQNLSAGGAARVPSSILSSCAPGWILNSGNNDYERTIVAHPPAPPNQFCRIDYPITQLVTAQSLQNQDWFFSARVGLAPGVPPTGASIEVLAEGNNPTGSAEFTSLGSVTLAPNQDYHLCMPVSLWSARNAFKIDVQVNSGGNNSGDLVFIENPRLVAIPLSHGLDSITDFGYFFGYTTGNYPSHAVAPHPAQLPQFDDIEAVSNCMIIHEIADSPPFHYRIDEARRLGHSVMWFGHSVFFDYYAGSTGLWPDYIQRWNNVKNTLIAPNLDVIKYLYIEEVYFHTGQIAATNAELALVGALVKSDFPQLKLIYGDVGAMFSGGLAASIDIPSSFDLIAFEAAYPTSGVGQEAQGYRAYLNLVAKPNHKFLLVPPCIDRSGASEVQKAGILEAFLEIARVDERYVAIAPFMWWWQPLPAFGDQLGLYDTPDASAYKRRYLALGKAIKERYPHREQTVMSGVSMGCAGAAELSIFSAERLTAGVPFVLSIRGAPLTNVALVMGAPTWAGFAPFGCGYILAPNPSLTSIVVNTDHMGRYCLRAPAPLGPFDMWFQAGYFVGQDSVLTKTVRMKY